HERLSQEEIIFQSASLLQVAGAGAVNTALSRRSRADHRADGCGLFFSAFGSLVLDCEGWQTAHLPCVAR
ncbi:hypothetical protein, partial [Pseudomonas syringae]|uniref:hypothetical protein n=1 Tax=Pseudomonas syringae TaxID=317 RepID=UPI0019D41113